MNDHQPICTVILKNEVAAVITGVHRDDMAILVDEFSEFVPGYKHMPLFKMKVWDGKTQFVTITGKTYQAFLPELSRRLMEMGYRIKLRDDRPPIQINVPLIDNTQFASSDWTHRPHQVAAINAVAANDHRGIIIAATSAGKTAMCAGISELYGRIGFRSIIIVPNRDLIRQTLAKYLEFGLDTGQYSGTVKDLDHQHVISTWQALKNHPEILLTFQVFVCDEVQGAKSPVVTKLLIKYGSHIPVRVGCTGTLPKDPADYQTIYAAIGAKEIYTITAKELQDQGLVATIHITQVITHDSDNPYEEQFAEFSMEQAALLVNDDRTRWIANFFKAIADTQGNTLVLVGSVKLGKQLAKFAGKDRCVFLYGQDKDEVRQAVYESFATNDNLLVFANVQIAAVGLSIDRIYNLGLVDIGKAFTRCIQSIGRGLRMAADKSHVEVYDVSSNYSFSGSHTPKRAAYYDEAHYPHEAIKVRYKRVDTKRVKW